MNNSYNPEIRGGGKAWAALGLGVAVINASGSETLSNAAARFRESSPAAKVVTYAAVGTVALHLLDLIPEKYDPLDTINHLSQKVKDRLSIVQ